MKTRKTPPELAATPDELRPEYSFDPAKGRPNPYVGRINGNRVVVLLDVDVSKVFKTPESVNIALRALISAMPAGSKSKSRSRSNSS